MIRVAFPFLAGAAMLALWIYALVDAFAADETLVRRLPKRIWIMIVMGGAQVGALAWLAFGRPAFASWRPGQADRRSRPPRPPRGPRILGPDDDPNFNPPLPPA